MNEKIDIENITNSELLINLDKLFDGKLYANAEDFAREFACSKGVGYKLIRGIKSISDIAELSGKVTKTDVLAWFLRPLK